MKERRTGSVCSFTRWDWIIGLRWKRVGIVSLKMGCSFCTNINK
jgi:hypothetical protein